MKSIFIMSESEYAGKSLVCICLGLDQQQKGKKVGYMKPFGPLPYMEDNVLTDEDALILKYQLRLDDDISDICPVVLTHDLVHKALHDEAPDVKSMIHDSYNRLSADKELLLLGGGRTMNEGKVMGYSSLEFAKDIESDVVMVERYEESRGLDPLLAARDILGDQLKGVILNRIDFENLDFLRIHLVRYLEARNIPVLGVIPTDKVLSAVSVEDLATALGAVIHTAEDRTGSLIHNFVVGAMNLNAATSRFRTIPNKAVITGGDRVDLQAAALDTSTKALILTGGIMPHPHILSKAEEFHVPVLSVTKDTLDTVDTINGLTGRPRLREDEKINSAVKLFKDNVDLSVLGL